jgi:hypothetical protein
MTTDRAFDFDDLIVLLDLDLGEPTDRADIEAIESVLDRRRTGGWSAPGPDRPGPALHLVPDSLS